MVSVCLPSDPLSQYLLSYLGFSHLVCGESLHGCSSKAQLLLLTLDEGYLLTTAILWLQSLSTVILEPKRKKSVIVSPSICYEVMGQDVMIFILNVEF